MKRFIALVPLFILVAFATGQQPKQPQFLEPLNVEVPPVSTDKAVQYDYDIVYVRAPRFGDEKSPKWAEIAHPVLMDPGADLMLLHPDGKEDLLVAGGEDGAIADPAISFDGESVYYSHVKGLKGTNQHGPPPRGGADIYKINLKSRKIVRLTEQVFTPNTGAAQWSKDFVTREEGKTNLNYGVVNMGPCPLPGGRVMFTSTRNAFRPPNGYPYFASQLFVMDDDGGNVEHIGHFNLAGALHPTILKDGRVLFSTLESQGLRSGILWGIWSIHPDGTNWGPVVSALLQGGGAPDAFHFQTQLSDESIVVERYYNQNNWGFGLYYKLPPQAPDGYAAFGPAAPSDPRNPPLRGGRFGNGLGKYSRFPFSPTGIESLTRFVVFGDSPSDSSVRDKKDAPAVGKFTHPSGAPDNHLLTVYSPGPVNHQNGLKRPVVDGGIYLIKDGKAIDEPAQMRLIKNDPKYNEQWPRAVVPYKRIYGVAEPKTLVPLRNDGTLSKLLPEGTPYGLIGTSSFYKRESYPQGVVPEGKVTATQTAGNDRNGYRGLGAFNSAENGGTLNWINQGADAGIYSNEEIHAVRIVAQEPTTDRSNGSKPGRLFHNAANERLRILGEIPLRKFVDGKQPVDPDGNPDTSFLAKIPADTPFTFQTIDKDGMVLNMSQTWHQLRPGEIRNDCGGCHAHSQKPTLFKDTFAARSDYKVFDLTQKTPLLTSKASDQSKTKWDANDETGLRQVADVKNVEYHRDVKPILQKSCVACHNSKDGKEPAGALNLDADDEVVKDERWGNLPGTFARLARDHRARFGYKPISDRFIGATWRGDQTSRYVRMFQARRSLLVWKVHGRRTDGWTNDDFPTELKPGDATTLHWKGKPLENTPNNRDIADLDYTGSAMPPPDAVAGTYVGHEGKKIKVEPLTDEDRRTLVRWIDLGCPIDLDYQAASPQTTGYGWMLDDTRPTLTLTYPRVGSNKELTRLLVGMHDYYSGLDEKSFAVVADFDIDGIKAGENLAAKFKPASPGVWELTLSKPVAKLPKGKLTVSVKDRQGNLSRIERAFSVE
ncbi:MAG: hypothetical protein K8T89_13090 [Planctomycetes bacterium]|nr:hypothetical protein [Planctomycetota bacterium]